VSRTSICAATLALALIGCGGPGTIDRADVEKSAQDELTKTVGQQAPEATCPEDLKAEVGATVRCHMDFPDDTRLGITVKVTSVDGDDAKFSITADDKTTKTP
jgi:hypothetical protein